MLLKVFVFTLLFTFSHCLFAQQIFFSEEYTTDGLPVNPLNTWNVEEPEQTVYVVLRAGEELIKGPFIYMFVDKSDDGQYYPYDSKAIKFEVDKEWLVYRYKFTESGKYSFYFRDAHDKEIAQKYITINLSGTSYLYQTMNTQLNYEGSKVVFCQVVIDRKPINERAIQSFNEHGRLCYVYIDNFRDLNTGKILVYFWKKKDSSFDYDELVDTKKYKVNPGWSDTFFKYSFRETGDYKVIIYNEKEVIIGNGFIQVVE